MRNFFVLLLAGCLLFFGCPGQDKPPRTLEEFSLILFNYDTVTIVEDISNASPRDEVVIYNCGADLAGSLGFMNKSVNAVVVDGNECITASGNTTKNKCLAESVNSYIFFIRPGANSSTKFFDSEAIIEVPDDYVGGCKISLPGTGYYAPGEHPAPYTNWSAANASNATS